MELTVQEEELSLIVNINFAISVELEADVTIIVCAQTISLSSQVTEAFPLSACDHFQFVITCLQIQLRAYLKGSNPLVCFPAQAFALTGNVIQRLSRSLTTYARYIKCGNERSGITIATQQNRILICRKREGLFDRFSGCCTAVYTLSGQEELCFTISSKCFHLCLLGVIRVAEANCDMYLITSLEASLCRLDSNPLAISIVIRVG